MASLSHSETRRLYSWWWDSHIPKNSKWLQENLTDMDSKVKAMIKLIEEDADSFARRAEMYYKKRPELMKMVEEFYRAYRALAERHDHLTGELRHAQRTIATAFPNQELLPFELDEDSPARSDVNLKAMYSSESDCVVKAEDEIHDLKKAITDVQAEKDMIFLQYQICLEKMSKMETDFVRAEKESLRVREQKDRAESEIETMKQVLASLEVEKEDALAKQQESIAQITDLQGIVSHTENESQRLIEEILRIESEKEAGIQTYKLCLEKISYLENKISLAEEDIKMFKEMTEKAENEVIKLKKLLAELTVEKEYTDFQYKNYVKRISDLETELACALEDVERLNTDVKVEAMKLKKSEEKSQSLSQEADDLAMKIAMKNLETSRKHTELENEILYLKTMKSRLEEEVIQQAGQTNSLQKEVSTLSEEINGLNKQYQDLLQKLESVGFNPDTIETSVKNLMNENSKLKENESIEKKKVLSKKLADMEEVSKNRNVFERSISQLNNQLEETQKTNQFLLGEKSVLFAEKGTLLTQLHTLTENMQKALVNNAVLENSLSVAKIELEGLREKSKGLEEICHLLKNEKYDLLTQRETLIVQLANVERRTVHMEIKYVNLEERYTDLKMLNKRLESEIQDLTLSLNTEKLERTKSVHRYETLLVNAQQHILCLQAENKRKKKEDADELEKSVRDEFELFILRNFIQDMEANNRSLLIGCRKYVESSKLAEKMISELERENLEEDMETELLINEIEKLRFGICLIFKVLESGSGHVNVSNQQVLVHQIIEIIEEMKRSIAKYKDEKRLLEVENGVLSTLLNQMALEGTEINSKKELLEEGKKVITEKLSKVQTEKKTLLETNELLKSRLALIQTDLSAKHCDIEKDYLDLLENHFQSLDENRCLFQECSDLNAEKCLLEEENDDLLLETLAFSIFSTVLVSFTWENSLELSTMDEVLYDMTETKDELEKDREILQGKLETKEEDNMFLEDVVQSFELDLLGLKDALRQKENELFESELKFQVEEKINLELANTLDMLKTRFQESSLEKEALEHDLLEKCEDKRFQQKKIEGLQEVNAKLREECEEYKNREEILSAELEAKDAEFELWDAEASVFYFDLQVLSVQEVLHENKVHELTETCGNLKDETVYKSREIKEMKGKLIRMESEIGELKADSLAYEPIIASLMDDVTSLEHSALLHSKLLMMPNDFETKSAGSDSNVSFEDTPKDDDDKLTVQNGIQDLGNLRLRINAVEKTIIEEIKKLVVQESPKVEGSKHTTVVNKISELKPHGGFIHRKAKEKKDLGRNLNENVKLFDVRTEALSSRKVISMKDIPLDQFSESFSKKTSSATERVEDKVLEMWETMQHNGLSEHLSGVSEVEKELGIDKLEVSSSNLGVESKEAAKTMKILERLASDARKLTVLQFEVENLNKKLNANKKLRKVKDVDLDTVKEQLQEVQETVHQLVEFNGKLIGNVVDTLHPKDEKCYGELQEEVSEEARNGSQKIGRLQVELQKIEYMLLKLDYEKKGRFSRNRTGIILRDFVYNGRKNIGKKKKSRFCGCFRSSSNREQIRM